MAPREPIDLDGIVGSVDEAVMVRAKGSFKGESCRISVSGPTAMIRACITALQIAKREDCEHEF